MGKHKFVLLAGLVVLIAMGGVMLLRGLGSNSSTGEAIAGGVPDPEEVRKIKATIVEAWKVGYIATQLTHDVSQFPSVFVDDPHVPLTPKQQEELRGWLGTVPKGAGYLTYSIAAFHNTERLNRLSQDAWAKATAAGRDYLIPEDYLTPEELKEIQESNRPIPTPPAMVRQPTMSAEEYVKWTWENTRFESVIINGDRAVVLYDDHWFLNEDILVRRDGKWYVAGHRRVGASRW